MKNIWKVCSIFNWQNFTGASDESEMSPKGEIGNSPVKLMWVNFLHQVNCETKYTIPVTMTQQDMCIIHKSWEVPVFVMTCSRRSVNLSDFIGSLN